MMTVMHSKKTKVIVLYGGRSAEHEVSCRSAAFILRNLDQSRYDVVAIGVDKQGLWIPQDTPALIAAGSPSVPIVAAKNTEAMTLLSDTSQETVVFSMIHGTGGEDGSIQGLFDLADVAYIGADTTGSAIGMDKVVAKKLARAAGLTVVPGADIRAQAWERDSSLFMDRAVAELGFPMFVKPCRQGSSVGISQARSKEELREAITTALAFDERVLVEQGLEVRELECAVLGDYEPEASVVGELVIQSGGFYDYSAKYQDDQAARIVIPAELSPEESEEIRRQAVAAFQALELYGMARVDFFKEKKSGKVYFNEVNTVPGFTEISQYPLLWEASGVSPQSLLDRLIDLALQRQAVRDKLQRSLD